MEYEEILKELKKLRREKNLQKQVLFIYINIVAKGQGTLSLNP